MNEPTAEGLAHPIDVLAELPEEQRRMIELRHSEVLAFAEIGRSAPRVAS